MKKGLLTLFLIVLLAACSTNNSAPELEAEGPSVLTDTRLIPSSTGALTLTSTATATPTITPTFTSLPTEEPPTTPTLTLTPTQTPRPTYTPTVTPDYALFQPLRPEFTLSFWYSPDGKWAAWQTSHSSFEVMDYVIIQNESGTKLWSVKRTGPDLFGSCYLGECGVWVAQWSPDGRYAYVAVSPRIDGMHNNLITPTIQVVRVDLETGALKYLLSGDKGISGFAISSDDGLFAYASRDNEQIIFEVKNLRTGEKTVVEKKIDSPGVLVWMPSNKGFVFSTYIFNYVYPDTINPAYFIWYFDLETLTFRKIFQTTDCYSERTEWISDDELRYICRNSNQTGEYLVLNTNTLQIQELNVSGLVK